MLDISDAAQTPHRTTSTSALSNSTPSPSTCSNSNSKSESCSSRSSITRPSSSPLPSSKIQSSMLRYQSNIRTISPEIARFRPSPQDVIKAIAPHVLDERRTRRRSGSRSGRGLRSSPRRSLSNHHLHNQFSHHSQMQYQQNANTWHGGAAAVRGRSKIKSSPLKVGAVISWDETGCVYLRRSYMNSEVEIVIGTNNSDERQGTTLPISVERLNKDSVNLSKYNTTVTTPTPPQRPPSSSSPPIRTPTPTPTPTSKSFKIKYKLRRPLTAPTKTPATATAVTPTMASDETVSTSEASVASSTIMVTGSNVDENENEDGSQVRNNVKGIEAEDGRKRKRQASNFRLESSKFLKSLAIKLRPVINSRLVRS